MLKAYLFAELSGCNGNTDLIETALAKNSKGEAILNGEALRLIANTNYSLLKTVTSAPEVNSNYTRAIVTVIAIAAQNFSSRLPIFSKADASTQTRGEGSIFYPPLYIAALRGDLDRVTTLLRRGDAAESVMQQLLDEESSKAVLVILRSSAFTLEGLSLDLRNRVLHIVKVAGHDDDLIQVKFKRFIKEYDCPWPFKSALVFSNSPDDGITDRGNVQYLSPSMEDVD